MSRKAPKKKDFYNGGRGIDLSDYCSKMSLNEPHYSLSDSNGNSGDLYRYSSYPDPVSPPASSPGYNNYPNNQVIVSPTGSPLPLSPASENYPSSPNSSFPNAYNDYDDYPQGSSYNHSLYPDHTNQVSAGLPIGAQVPPYGGCPMPSNYHVGPVVPAPCFAGYMPQGSYARSISSPEMPPLEGPYNEDPGMPLMAPPGADSNGVTEGSKKKKRQQKCSLCSNHGVTVDVKGHKWFCPYRNCDCERCEITKGRQHHMKEQQKLTRSLQRMQ